LTITGQVENRVSKIQRNVHVTSYFYDSKGNNVGGPYKGTVNPTVLTSLQLGAFNIKASTSVIKGTPSFLRLEYQLLTPLSRKSKICSLVISLNKVLSQ
jgi:hypothetical protein